MKWKNSFSEKKSEDTASRLFSHKPGCHNRKPSARLRFPATVGPRRWWIPQLRGCWQMVHVLLSLTPCLLITWLLVSLPQRSCNRQKDDADKSCCYHPRTPSVLQLVPCLPSHMDTYTPGKLFEKWGLTFRILGTILSIFQEKCVNM